MKKKGKGCGFRVGGTKNTRHVIKERYYTHPQNLIKFINPFLNNNQHVDPVDDEDTEDDIHISPVDMICQCVYLQLCHSLCLYDIQTCLTKAVLFSKGKASLFV